MIMCELSIFKLIIYYKIITITLIERRITYYENQFNKYERESKDR